jgi:predicted RNase H-like HicB family nuclease
MNKYGFKIQWSDEDQGYVATSPEFPGLSAFGETEEGALAEAKTARQLFIDDMLESGEELPPPQMAHEYSGQTRLRLSKTVHRLVAEMAASEGISLNQFIVDAINERIGAQKAGSRLVGELKKALAENAQQRRVDLASIVWQEDRGTQHRRVVKTLAETTETTDYLGTDIIKIKGN